MTPFTEDQLKAIQLREGDLLVAAAAGSGKTAVLVQRIIEMISHKEKPVDLDRLLVVTFTDAAATEMRRRIADALSARLEKEPSDKNLCRQWALLNKASISTVHSFCLKVIRTHFHLIDLDPDFRIGDQGEIRLLKSEMIDSLFEEEYAKADNDSFFRLVEAYGGGKTKDDNLQELILRLYEFARSNPRPTRWLHCVAKNFDAVEGVAIDESPWAKIMEEEIKRTLRAIRSAIQRGIRLAGSVGGPEKYIPVLLSDQAVVDWLLNIDGFTSFYNAFDQTSFDRLPAYKAKEEVDVELKEQVKVIRDKEIKKAFTNLKARIFFKPPYRMGEDLHNLAPFVKTLCCLTEDFGMLYTRAKKEKNIVDFSDLEHYCLEILLDEGDSPTLAAQVLGDRYDEILIDEYQDSNLIQELILSSISRNNRFMVGDVKQSIYKFRQAKPEIFMEKYKGDTATINLSMNFRSRANLLYGVNFLFRQLMRPVLGGLVYDEKAALYPGAKFPNPLPEADTIELHLIDYKASETQEAESAQNPDGADEALEEISRAEWEARIVAERIDQLMNPDKPFLVTDDRGKGGDTAASEYRPARYGDIVILMRSVSSVAEAFLQELKRYNIPAYAGTSEGFFGSLEIITAVSFLQIVDNPRQDIPLITILHSPVYHLDSNSLMEIRGCLPKGSYFDCVCAYLEQGEDWGIGAVLEKFMEDLAKWRKLATTLPIHQIVGILYRDTSYYTYVGAMAGGKVRQANLDALHQRAIQYEATSYKGLFHFIKYLEKLKKTGGDEGDAAVSSENEDLVRIMTIHKSKGLEFPIVFVSMLGKNFNMQDQRESLLMHEEGLGPVYIDLENRIRSNSLARLAIASVIRQENLAEELRVLYVALTRAKEKLIMTGSCKDLEKTMRDWAVFAEGEETVLPDWQLLKANHFLDWLMPSLIRREESEAFGARFRLFLHNRPAPVLAGLEKSASKREWLDNLRCAEKNRESNKIYEEINAKFSWRYPFVLSTGLPTKVPISEIKRNYHLQMFPEYGADSVNASIRGEELGVVFSRPTFLTQGQKLTSTQRGTAIHTVMEHLDLNLHKQDEDIRRLIETLCAKALLTKEEAATVPVDKIIKFTSSTLAERMRRSTCLKRETPFVMGLSPYEVFFEERYKEPTETILVHGIIDCYFMEGEEIVLVDYKSDRLNPNEIEKLKAKYALQLKLYKRAIQEAENKKVKECVLYLFGIDEAVPAL